MQYNHLSRWFFFLCALSGRYRVDLDNAKKDFSAHLVLMSSLIEGKGFGFGRGGGFKGGSARRSGIFGGSSSYNRGSSYGGYMSKP
jgi:hypothetical protein